MTWNLVSVGVGGLIGCLARFLVVSFTGQFTVLPWGTLLVNIVGCLIIGAGAGLAENYEWMRGEGRILLLAGFCGGFTTYSAFALENFQFLIEKNYLAFGGYSLITFVLCLGATAVGFFLATR